MVTEISERQILKGQTVLAKNESTNLVYILGLGHTGSTLLDMLLGAHPRLFSLGEMNFFDDWVIKNKQCVCGKAIWDCDIWSEILAKYTDTALDKQQLPESLETDFSRRGINSPSARLQRFGTKIGHIALINSMKPALLQRLAPQIAARATNVHQLYDIVRLVSGKPIVVDSSKSGYRMSVLYTTRHSDGIRVIFLTRDGRAWLPSYIRTMRRFEREIGAKAAAYRWWLMHRYMLRVLKVLPRESYLHVHYEELCREPEQTANRVCDFIGVPYEPDMLNFRGKEHHNLGGNLMRFRDTSDIKEDLRWREQLDARAVADFEKIAGKLNRCLLGEWYVP